MRTGIAVGIVCLLLGWIAPAFADGPHWYIPEPPEDEYKLIDMDEATIARYMKAMQIQSKRNILKRICQVCIRYLREYESYVAAPDSPEPWHSQEGREKMAEYALETLRILQAQSAPLLVEALADQVRFMDDIRAGRISARMKNFVAANKKINTLLQKLMANVKDGKIPRHAGGPMRKQYTKMRAQYRKLSGEAQGAKGAVQNEFPRSFVHNVTGDIPFMQDDADSRMIEAIRRVGWACVPHLQKLLRNPNVRVAKTAAEILRTMAALRRNPPPMTADVPTIVRELRRINSNIRNPRSPEIAYALRRIQSLKKVAWPVLIEIAESEKYRRLRRTVFWTLQYLTRQRFGKNLAKWKKWVAEHGPKPRPKAAPKPQPKKPAAAEKPQPAPVAPANDMVGE